MNILAGRDMNVFHRVFPRDREWRLAVSVTACFALHQDNHAPLDFQAMWPTVEAALGLDEVFDLGMPKPRGEFLVYGAAHAPRPVRVLEVRVRVGDHAKVLNVFGDRIWAGGGPSQPQPFRRMPINYRQAFGGPGHPENPLGKGASIDTAGHRPMPNIQDPAHLLRSPEDRPPPAGFTAYPPTWPRRMRFMGSVDKDYLLDSWPWFPAKTSPEHFNTAPEDQRIEGFFRGDEALEIQHMHPVKTHIRSSLPGIRARVFVHRHDNGGEIFAEVPCAAETIWLFPGQERGVVLFRGVTIIGHEEHADVLHIFARWESLSETPKSLEYYLGLFREELQPAAETHAFSEQREQSEQPSAGSAVAVSVAAVAGMGDVAAPSAGLEQLVQEAEALQAQTAKLLSRAGLNPGEVFRQAAVAQAMPEAAEIEDINVLMANLEKQSKVLLARFNLDEQEVLKLLEARPAPQSLFVDEIIARLRASGLTSPAIEARFLEVDVLLKEAAGTLAALADLGTNAPDPAAASLSEQQFEPASYSEGQSGPARGESVLDVDQVMAMHAAGQTLSRLDLTGLDFSGRDLTGADFTESILDRCVFMGASLAKAVLSGAILSAANMEGADLHEANLREVYAARCTLQGANLSGADLSQGDFTKANLADAIMCRAVLHGAVFDHAGMTGIKAQEIQAIRAGFMTADLTGATFVGANLEEADFSAADMTRADLSGIKAPELRLHGTRCSETIFRNAVLHASRADQEATFQGANLSGADLCRACWDGADLSAADLSGAVLDSVDFSRANLSQANLRLASAREAKLMQANLEMADLTAINLFKGSLRKANLVNAIFRSSNLYGVDFYKAILGNTNLEGANLKMTLQGMGHLP